MVWRERIQKVFESYGPVAYVFQDYIAELGWGVDRVGVLRDSTGLYWSAYLIDRDDVLVLILLDDSIVTIKYGNGIVGYDLARDDCLDLVEYHLNRAPRQPTRTTWANAASIDSLGSLIPGIYSPDKSLLISCACTYALYASQSYLVLPGLLIWPGDSSPHKWTVP